MALEIPNAIAAAYVALVTTTPGAESYELQSSVGILRQYPFDVPLAFAPGVGASFDLEQPVSAEEGCVTCSTIALASLIVGTVNAVAWITPTGVPVGTPSIDDLPVNRLAAIASSASAGSARHCVQVLHVPRG